MKFPPVAYHGRSGASLSLVALYFLLTIITLTTSLPIKQQSDSISTVQLPKAHEQRSLPGSLATAPKGAVGEPPSPVSGSAGHINTEPTKKPVYFTLLMIAVFVCVIIVLFERL